MRTFIALELPDDVRTVLAAAQQELQAAQADVSWTRPESLHLTLKFLGEIEAGQVGAVSEACARSVAGSGPFKLSVRDVGMLPNAKQPRVFYAGLRGETETLMQVQARLEGALAALGFAKESRAFRPHITLGRVKSARNLRELVACATRLRLATDEFEVVEIVLMQSELRPAGARYSPLARFNCR